MSLGHASDRMLFAGVNYSLFTFLSILSDALNYIIVLKHYFSIGMCATFIFF